MFYSVLTKNLRCYILYLQVYYQLFVCVSVCIFSFLPCFFLFFMLFPHFLCQGYGSFLLRDLPFDAMQFCIYEQLRLGYKLAVSFHLRLRRVLDLFSSLRRLRTWLSRRNSKLINLDFHWFGGVCFCHNMERD